MLSLLLAPCSPVRLDEALTAGATVVVADLTMEADVMERRRGAVAAWLREARRHASPPALYVRIHELESGCAEDDLDALFPLDHDVFGSFRSRDIVIDSHKTEYDVVRKPVPAFRQHARAPHGILLPSCRSVEDVQRLGAKLAVREAEHGLPDGAIRIVATPASSAGAVLALGPYAQAGARLAGLVWDGEALARDLSVRAEEDAPPLVVARGLTILAARAAGVPALDTMTGGTPDEVKRTCRRARGHGFRGAVTRDPGQARLIAAAYAPPLKTP